jgi:hypothetical protein
MEQQTFSDVWYRPSKNSLLNTSPIAFYDKGTLKVGEGVLEFRGEKGVVNISNIQSIAYGKQGKDMVNNWVKVDYGSGQQAFFADGSLLGWGGIFGGTQKLLKALQQASKR